jgi:hypothetical protein
MLRQSTEQCVESGLFEVNVVRERSGYAALFHDVEGNAIGEGPFFVRATSVQIQAGAK